MTTATKTKPASQRSIDYLTDLTRKRQVNAGTSAEQDLVGLTKWLARKSRSQGEVSELIGKALDKPVRAVWAPTAVPGSSHTAYVPYPAVPEAVPSSKFAILTELLTECPTAWAKQEYLFFEVKQLRGKRVVRRLLGAPGRFNRNALPAALARQLFDHLEDQAAAYQAAKTFGEIYSVCGRCGAELTDDTSREHKFGPVCWDLMEPWRTAAGL